MYTLSPASGSPDVAGDGDREAHTPTMRGASAPVGMGCCEGHMGEIAQGVALIPSGGLVRCLVTMPCDLFGARARFLPDDSGSVHVAPDGYWKARTAVEKTFRALGIRGLGGCLEVGHNIPEKIGCGSSTATVVSAIRAAAGAVGARLDPDTVARITVESECASDSIMFPPCAPAVLFAHREGRIVEVFPGPLPRMQVLSFNTDPAGEGVDTLKHPRARYSAAEIERFGCIWMLMRYACRHQDVGALGRAATLSARIDQRFLPKPRFDRLLDLQKSTGALGVHVSHSGTVAGLIYAPDDRNREQAQTAEAELSRWGFGPFWHFTVGNPRP